MDERIELLQRIIARLGKIEEHLRIMSESHRKHRHVWIRDFEGVPVCKSCGEERE